MTRYLPDGFEALETFAPFWAVEGLARRAALRAEASAQQRQAFYDAVRPLAAAALDRLDTRPLAQHDAREQRLLNLLLAFTHVALAVEVQGDDESRHARYRQHMHLTRAPDDALAQTAGS